MPENIDVLPSVGGTDADDSRQNLAVEYDERIGVSIGPYGMWVLGRDD